MADSFNGIVIEDNQTVEECVRLQNLQVTGNAMFLNTVEADRIEVPGSARFQTFVTCDRLDVSGSAVLMGRLLTETLRATGPLTAIKRIWTEVAVFENHVILQGPLNASRVVIRTDATVNATAKMKIDRVTVNGQLTSGSTLRSLEAEFISCAYSDINEILTDRIAVRYKARADVPGISPGDYLLVVSFLDAGNASLEYTYAEQMYCDSAVIGNGCRIRQLTYRDQVEIAPGAVVERVLKA